MNPVPVLAFLSQRLGLEPESIGNSLKQTVRRCMVASGASNEQEYMQLIEQWDGAGCTLLQNGKPGCTAACDLIDSIVVPETCFFRDTEPFRRLSHLAHEHLQSCKKSRPKPFRVLSAPCSTGEEPYSAAMTLLDAGLSPEYISVDGVDISPAALEKAKCGTYTSGSFRSDNLSFRNRYFSTRPPQDGSVQSWEIIDTVKKCVRFFPLNLANATELAMDAVTSLQRSYDAVFCRNFMIYLDSHTRDQVLSTMRSKLAPEGEFFVGHAEAVLTMGAGFTPVNHARSFAFRKEERQVSNVTVSRKAPKQTLRKQQPLMGIVPDAVSAKPNMIMPDSQAEGPCRDMSKAREYADKGRLNEALEICGACLETDPMNITALYLSALICDASGREKDAFAYMNKAVYLDPDNREILVQAALLCDRIGKTEQARQLRTREKRVTARNRKKAGKEARS